MLSEAQTSTSSSLRRPPLCPDHPLFKDVGKVTASYRGTPLPPTLRPSSNDPLAQGLRRLSRHTGTGLPAPSAKALAYYEDNNLFAAELNVRTRGRRAARTATTATNVELTWPGAGWYGSGAGDQFVPSVVPNGDPKWQVQRGCRCRCYSPGAPGFAHASAPRRDGGWKAEEGNDVPRVLRNAVRYAMATQRKRGA